MPTLAQARQAVADALAAVTVTADELARLKQDGFGSALPPGLLGS